MTLDGSERSGQESITAEAMRHDVMMRLAGGMADALENGQATADQGRDASQFILDRIDKISDLHALRQFLGELRVKAPFLTPAVWDLLLNPPGSVGTHAESGGEQVVPAAGLPQQSHDAAPIATKLNAAEWQTLRLAPICQLYFQALDGRQPSDAQLDVFEATIARSDNLEMGLWRDILQTLQGDTPDLEAAFDRESRTVDAILKDAMVLVVTRYGGKDRLDYGLGMGQLAYDLVRADAPGRWSSVAEFTRKKLVLGATAYVGLPEDAYGLLIAKDSDALDDPILGLQGRVRAGLAAQLAKWAGDLSSGRGS